MKYLYLLILLTLLCSCVNEPSDEVREADYKLEKARITAVYQNFMDKTGTVIVFDSCEYVIFNVYREGYMAHKGQCKFCKERNLIKNGK